MKGESMYELLLAGVVVMLLIAVSIAFKLAAEEVMDEIRR